MSYDMPHKLPLTMDEMKPFIIDPTLSLVVDYHNSQLKDRALLIYCTNINLPGVDIDFTGCSDEEVCALLDAYVTHKSVVNIPCLVDMLVHIMLYFKGIPTPKSFMSLTSTVPTNGVIQQFLRDSGRVERLSKMMHVLDSIPLFIFTTNASFAETYGPPETVFPTVDDIHYTGYTFVNMLNHQLFVTCYYTNVIAYTDQVYFKQQFAENLFEGKPLFYFFTTQPNNYLLSLFDTVFSGKLSPDISKWFNDAVLNELAKGTPNDIPV